VQPDAEADADTGWVCPCPVESDGPVVVGSVVVGAVIGVGTSEPGCVGCDGIEGWAARTGECRVVGRIGVLGLGAETVGEPGGGGVADLGGLLCPEAWVPVADGPTTTVCTGGEPGPAAPRAVGGSCTVPEWRSTASATAPRKNGTATSAARRASCKSGPIIGRASATSSLAIPDSPYRVPWPTTGPFPLPE
jgi:hypothetical protein